MNREKDIEVGAVDISDVQPSQGDYLCPCCYIFMLPLSLHDYETISSEVQCPSFGYKLDPMTDQTKHAYKLTPKITEEMISEEEEGGSNIFEVIADEDSGRTADDNDEPNDFTEDDKRDEESLKRKGYRILSSNEF
jgi:hypothetical protein